MEKWLVKNGSGADIGLRRAGLAPKQSPHVAASLDSWHRADALQAAVTLAVVDREDVAPSIPPAGWHCVRVHMPRLDISSTDLRRRIAAGESVDYLVPLPAARVLRQRGLYTGE